MLHLKTHNKALWNGKYGGKFVRVKNDKPKSVYSYRRVKDDSEVLVVLNFSNKDLDVTLEGFKQPKKYTNVFTDRPVTIASKPISINAHGYLVLAK